MVMQVQNAKDKGNILKSKSRGKDWVRNDNRLIKNNQG